MSLQEASKKWETFVRFLLPWKGHFWAKFTNEPERSFEKRDPSRELLCRLIALKKPLLGNFSKWAWRKLRKKGGKFLRHSALKKPLLNNFKKWTWKDLEQKRNFSKLLYTLTKRSFLLPQSRKMVRWKCLEDFTIGLQVLFTLTRKNYQLFPKNAIVILLIGLIEKRKWNKQ